MTEGVLIGDPEEARVRLEALRALGVRLALDDFGTSSLRSAVAFQLPVIPDAAPSACKAMLAFFIAAVVCFPENASCGRTAGAGGGFLAGAGTGGTGRELGYP